MNPEVAHADPVLAGGGVFALWPGNTQAAKTTNAEKRRQEWKLKKYGSIQ
jgi:hypothetical protein